MKICHITSAHNRTDARIFKRQCLTLAKNGFEVIFVCCDGKKDEIVDNIKITSYSSTELSKKERFSLLYKNKRFISYLLDINADIYQFHDIELIEVGRKLAKKKKVIFDSHENWKGYVLGLLPQNKFVQYLFSKSFDFYYYKYLRYFSAVFTVSPNFVRDLKKFTENVFMVSNYPSLKSFAYDAFNTEKINDFIYAGTVYGISNQINIVKSLNDISKKYNVKYTIVGKISEELKNDILNTEGADNVDFINWVSKEELNKLLVSSRAGLVLLDYVPICGGQEGQLGSNKIFEYMYAGIPVICTDFKLWKELIIDKYNCGVCVNPRDVEGIVKAMDFIMSNPEEAKKMGERGREAVLSEFNWEHTEKEYVNLYEMIYKS